MAVEIDHKALAALPFDLRVEIAENLCRKDLTPSELDAIRRRCTEIFAEQAKERQRQHGGTAPGRRADTPRKLSGSDVAGETSAKIGALFGISGRNVEKIARVSDAAQREPERFGPLLAEMDRTGRVNGAYRQLVVAQKAEAINAEPAPLPAGPFRTIVADPPWRYENRARDISHRAANPFPDLSVDEICCLPVEKIAHDDAILWLWVTNSHLREAFRVVDAWGFIYKSLLTWAKDRMGTGDWLRGQTEHCLLGVRGKPTLTLTNQTTLIFGPLREHSRKPDEFYELVEGLCPGSKVELFCRSPRPGWAVHGDEVR